MRRIIWFIAIVAVIIIGGYYALKKKEKVQPSVEPSVAVTTPSETQSTGAVFSNTISAQSQSADTKVSVAKAELAQAGYVVIHEDSAGKPGAVLGYSSLLAAGSFVDVLINLNRKTKPGEVLYAMLHKDMGDGVYNFPGDDGPITDAAGKVIVAKFTVHGVAPAQNQEGAVLPKLETKPTTEAPASLAISLESGYFFFTPSTITAKKGQKVRVSFKNAGSHTFTIDELGVNISMRDASGDFEFTPNKTGRFEFYCAVPGHREAGQKGTLVVE